MGSFSTVFLDLDDTLYPSSSGVWDAIGDRIQVFLMNRLALGEVEAKTMRRSFFQDYGTTLNGLIANHLADPQDYLAFVHDIPLEEYLRPDAGLRAMLRALPQQRIVFTNSHRRHAERVLEALAVRDQIDQILDIVALGFRNKPEVDSYTLAMAAADHAAPQDCLFVDDMLRNLRPAAAIGMTTVHVAEVGDPDPAPHYRIRDIKELTTAIPGLLDGRARPGTRPAAGAKRLL
jgi:putative hydrolase of the HAD superfamily